MGLAEEEAASSFSKSVPQVGSIRPNSFGGTLLAPNNGFSLTEVIHVNDCSALGGDSNNTEVAVWKYYWNKSGTEKRRENPKEIKEKEKKNEREDKKAPSAFASDKRELARTTRNCPKEN